MGCDVRSKSCDHSRLRIDIEHPHRHIVRIRVDRNNYVTSFGCSVAGEYDAFDTYIKTHRGESLVMLIDTYDTLRCGVLNAIKAFKDNGIDDSYEAGYGVRLDSGDLADL